VTYERRVFNVRARREVILSAGTLGTAKLLMFTGIGPKDDLERIGVTQYSVFKCPLNN